MELIGQACNRLRFHSSHRIHAKKTDWNNGKCSLVLSIHSCEELIYNSSLDIQSKYSTFMAIVKEAIRSNTPARPTQSHKYNQFKFKASPWWNEECEEKVRLRKAAFLKFKHLSTLENFLSYKRLDASAKSFFQMRKKEYFLEFCGSLNKFSSLKYMWHKIRAMNNKFHRKETANSYDASSSNIITDQFNDLCPPWCSPEPLFEDLSYTSVSFPPFSLEELNHIIDSARSDSCPGSDGIDYRTLQSLPL